MYYSPVVAITYRVDRLFVTPMIHPKVCLTCNRTPVITQNGKTFVGDPDKRGLLPVKYRISLYCYGCRWGMYIRHRVRDALRTKLIKSMQESTNEANTKDQDVFIDVADASESTMRQQAFENSLKNLFPMPQYNLRDHLHLVPLYKPISVWDDVCVKWVTLTLVKLEDGVPTWRDDRNRVIPRKYNHHFTYFEF